MLLNNIKNNVNAVPIVASVGDIQGMFFGTFWNALYPTLEYMQSRVS